MNPILLRQRLQNNNEDVKAFCADLKQWSKEMYDNESKTDVEKFPDNLTHETDKPEFLESAIEQANLEKDQGNRFVKEQKWDEAIKCYTNAIKCYGRNPIYFANRALCYLKLSRWKDAVEDCSVAIDQDKTYVKAYQRRAAAREQLHKLSEAKSDLETVLKYEPKNKESQKQLKIILEKIEYDKESERKFALYEQTHQQQKKRKFKTEEKKVVETPSDFMHLRNDKNIEIVHPVEKPPHLRSKDTLMRIDICDESCKTQQIKPKLTLNTEDLKIVERRQENVDANKQAAAKPDAVRIVFDESFVPPTNSVQFTRLWSTLHKSEEKHEFLKRLGPDSIPKIFVDTLDSRLFSDIVSVLVENVKKQDKVIEYLVCLSHVKRFSTLVMFMSAKDKSCVKQLLEHGKMFENVNDDTINYLISQYQL